MSSFLHGVETLEIDDGIRPISTVASAVIGLVGTAPDAEIARKASASVGSVADNTGIAFSANQSGIQGNAVSVRLVDPGAASASLMISVSQTAVSVQLETDATGAVISTATEVIAAVTSSPLTALLLDAGHATGSDGSGVVSHMRAAALLSGGLDEAFPLNTPVLVAGSRIEAAALDTVGNGSGTLPDAIDGIFDQHGAAVVVVRVEDTLTTSDLERVAALSLSYEVPQNTVFSHLNVDLVNSIVMAAPIKNLDGSAGGEIFELGGDNLGSYVGFRADGDLVIRCGKGGSDSGTYAHLIVDSGSAPSGTGTLIWQFSLDEDASEYSVRAWWEPVGGAWVELTGTTNAAVASKHSGTSDGAFWEFSSPSVLGEVSDQTPAGEPAGPLRMYFNQQVPAVLDPADAALLPEADAQTLANIIGGVHPVTETRTGIQVLLDAQSTLGVVPRVLLAPSYSQNEAVATELVAVAEKLRATCLIDGPNSTDADAISVANGFGSDRLFLTDPWVAVFDVNTATYIDRPPSPRVAGLIAKMDAEKGFWWSPSNQVINGIVGTSRPINFNLYDPTSRGQLLNAGNVATVANVNGLRLMGNRTTAIDPNWSFLSVRRTADMIYESIEKGHQWALDRPFSKQLLLDIRDGVAAYLRSLEARGATLGGSVWIDPDLNTETTLKAGQLYIDFDFEPPAPLERLSFRASRNGDYYEELISEVSSAT